ncbi:hypothetical protein ARSEF4850_008610 [Beauveria asiatica]
MSLIFRAWSRLFGHGAPLQPGIFANPNFVRIPADVQVEEEALPDYLPARYYPMRIGEVLVDRYQVVGKLGFGASSTVWLAHDLHDAMLPSKFLYDLRRLEITSVGNEIAMFNRLEQRKSSHPGRSAVRTLLDSFRLDGPEGEHLVLAHPPLWRSIEVAIRRTWPRRLPASGLRYVLKDLFLALEYLHDECQIIHTDIKVDNIMFSIKDSSVFTEFEEEEMNNPCPRKEVEGRTIYTSRALKSTGLVGPPVLCDFGSAVFGDAQNIETPWDYKIDIWNVGCMIWDIFEGKQLFYTVDPEHKAYRRRAHLAEIMALLGPLPKDLLTRGRLASKFFSDQGTYAAGLDLPRSTSLEEQETLLTGDDKKHFLELMRKMLQWGPERRSTARELLQDAWLQEQT